MKRKFLIGIVWTSILTFVLSFIITVNCLNGKDKISYKSKKIENEIQSIAYKINNETNKIDTKRKIKFKGDIDLPQIRRKQLDKEKAENNDEIENKKELYILPVNGEILTPFSNQKLKYYKTLNEWSYHPGIDYKTEIGKEVRAIQDGNIKSISFDKKYGNYVLIEHKNNYESFYSNVKVIENLKSNMQVKKGQIIGKVMQSFGIEELEEPHLHFEFRKNGNNIDFQKLNSNKT